MNKVLSTVLLGSMILGIAVPSVYAIDGSLSMGSSDGETYNSIVQNTDAFDGTINDTYLSVYGKLILESGKVKEIIQNEDSVVSGFLISTESGSEIFISVSDKTLYLDSDNISNGSLSDIKVDSTIYVYRSLVETRSLPPQTHGYIVLYNVSDSVNVPRFCKVESVEVGTGSGEKVILTDNGGLYIAITENTVVKEYGNTSNLTLSDISVGDTLLCWTGPVMFSYPAQTTSDIIMKVSGIFDNIESNNEDTNSGISIENYKDITSEHRAYEAFKVLVERGIVTGISQDMMAPDNTLTRSSFVTMLSRACVNLNGVEDLSQYKGVSQFKDNILEAWFNPFVNWAFEHGVTNGISENEFGVNNLVTKEQMVQMIYNFVKNNNVKIDIVEAKNELVMDYDSCSSWAMEAINWAGNLGILDLDEDGNYHPTEEATRSDMAILLTNFLNILIINESVSE